MCVRVENSVFGNQRYTFPFSIWVCVCVREANNEHFNMCECIVYETLNVKSATSVFRHRYTSIDARKCCFSYRTDIFPFTLFERECLWYSVKNMFCIAWLRLRSCSLYTHTYTQSSHLLTHSFIRSFTHLHPFVRTTHSTYTLKMSEQNTAIATVQRSIDFPFDYGFKIVARRRLQLVTE